MPQVFKAFLLQSFLRHKFWPPTFQFIQCARCSVMQHHVLCIQCSWLQNNCSRIFACTKIAQSQFFHFRQFVLLCEIYKKHIIRILVFQSMLGRHILTQISRHPAPLQPFRNLFTQCLLTIIRINYNPV